VTQNGRGQADPAAKVLAVCEEAVQLRTVLPAEDLHVRRRAGVRRHDDVVIAVRVEVTGGHVQAASPARRERLQVVEQRPESLLAVEDLYAWRGSRAANGEHV